jgi:hypothetical protein
VDGPVGFFFATIGLSSSVVVARVWEYVSLESYLNCDLSCPVRSSNPFQLHHAYYGLGLLSAAFGVLAFAKRQRARWDTALFFGIGVGLFTDESGLLLLGISYSSLPSLLFPALFGMVLLGGTVIATLRDGTREFRVLDRADSLTIVSILLGMAGVLYLDRPLIVMVEVAGAVFWTCATILIVVFGKKHFLRVWGGLA